MARREAAQPTRTSSRLNGDYVKEKEKDKEVVAEDHGGIGPGFLLLSGMAHQKFRRGQCKALLRVF